MPTSKFRGRDVEARVRDAGRGTGRARRLDAPALRLPLSARRRRHPADGRGQDPALPRHPVPARLAAGAEGHAPAGQPGRRRWIASSAGADICPDLAIRSTFIVGFPGETEEDFEFLLDWLRRRNSTASAASKYEPWRQAEISEQRLAAKVGSVQPVLIDLLDGELAIGRSRFDAPEIDGLVQIQDGEAAGLKPGDIVDVHIMGNDEHDLFGLVEVDEDEFGDH
jgi:hypothetical protein